jgi:hypothetical protein
MVFFYLVCETIGTAATPGLLCQPRVIVKMIVDGYLGAHKRRDIPNTGPKRNELELLFSLALSPSYIPATNFILSVVHFVSFLH